MAFRKPIVVANWKMELSHKASLETLASIQKLARALPDPGVDIVICPSYPVLPEMAAALARFKTKILQLGAQHVHWTERGAWTGQVSVVQVRPFISWCIVGHSEQRALTGETDDQVQQSADLLLKHGIVPLVCVGESIEERSAGQAVARVTDQILHILGKATRVGLSKLVFVYEPIWAIGTGELPEPADVTETMLLIRKLAAERFGNEAADRLRILYGGSVTPDNVASFVGEPGIDGVLVGGASLRPASFVRIVSQVQQAASI